MFAAVCIVVVSKCHLRLIILLVYIGLIYMSAGFDLIGFDLI